MSNRPGQGLKSVPGNRASPKSYMEPPPAKAAVLFLDLYNPTNTSNICTLSIQPIHLGAPFAEAEHLTTLDQTVDRRMNEGGI